jgi:DNA-binding MarR family transcriptional regulator
MAEDEHAMDAVAAIEQALVAMRRSWARRSLQRRAATGAGTTGAAGVGTGAGGMGTTEAAAFQVLDAIEEATGPGRVISVNGVADALGVDQPRASRLVARVVDAGLVRRGSDPDDGRRSILALTPRGARVLAEAHRTRRDAVEAALGGWSDEDRETFARLLRAYVTGWERAIGRRR